MSEPVKDEAEVLDGLPVLPGQPTEPELSVRSPGPLGTVLASPAQAAAVAVGGFVAGAAVVGLAHRRQSKRQALVRGGRSARTRRIARGERTGRRGPGELVQVVASRTLLVDVHLLGSPAGES